MVMKRMHVTLVMIAVLAAIGSGIASYRFLLAAAAARQHGADAGHVNVLVARRTLRAGDELQSNDLRWQRWPSAGLAPGMVAQAEKPDAQKQLAGMRVAFPLAAGQPLMPDMLLAGGALSGQVRPGYRAMTVSTGEEIAAGGFLAAGDRVDVIAVETARTGRRTHGETLLRGVRVLAVPGAANGPRALRKGGTVILEVSPAQAEMLSAARRRGDLSLALAGDEERRAGAATDGLKPLPLQDRGVVSLIKYGITVTQTIR